MTFEDITRVIGIEVFSKDHGAIWIFNGNDAFVLAALVRCTKANDAGAVHFGR
jgi:hypothetical protein